MKKLIFYLFMMFFLLATNGDMQAEEEGPVLKGPYLGQKPPGMTPQIFAPGIVSKSESRDLMHGFFDNGKLFIMYRYPVDFKGDWTKQPLILMKQINGKWSTPFESKLIGKPWIYNLDTVPLGKRMIFAWTKHLDGSGPTNELYLWSSTRTANGWARPYRFKAPVNTGFETWPSLSRDKTLYFFSRRPGGFGKFDIYLSKPEQGKYKKVKNLGQIINTKYTEEDPYIAPNGSYLLFDSDRPGGYGGYDIYITWRKKEGSWTKPVNLGNRINTKYSECRAYVSSDGKYLFFTSSRTETMNAWWVSTKIIEELKP